MSCTSDPPSGSLRERDTRAAQHRARGRAGLAFLALIGAGCTGTIGSLGPGAPPPQTGGGGMAGTGPGGGIAGSGQSGGMSGTGPGGATAGSSQVGGTSGTGGTAPPVVLSKGGVMLRLLTQAEYLTSVKSLLGTLTTPLTAPDDTSVAGFVAVGAGQMSVTDNAATAYETASLAATAEVFGNAQRWQMLVGCTPKADLSDACVATYIRTFGRAAFRRNLADEEVQQWLGVAKNAAMLAGTAAYGLQTATSGLLQSPNFLYRVEANKVDSSNGRLKYDGLSMANRLSYLLTGGPPSPALLDAAASGQLDTADGVRAAAAPLLMSAGITDRMTAFFSEYAQAQQVLVVSKSTSMFPTFNEALKSSMLQGLQLFLKNVVLAPNADVRSFYDSDQTFVDAKLASLYGVQAPGSGFAQVKLPASSGRAGILGQAGLIAAQSQSDRTSPTRRGIFILESMLCTTPQPPPAGVDTSITIDPTLTARQQLELHRANVQCAGCHMLFDPLGIALEHFDAIGRYRETENGLAIDTTGSVGALSFDGAAQLGAALRQEPRALPCLMRNFYRNANGRAEDDKDPEQINRMVQSLSAGGYVWSKLLADFVASDAFRSAPALPVTGSM
jgi:hypothetical protein